MRALVTGATGCVGANIVAALLDQGYAVRALRRATSRLDALDDLAPTYVVGDVLDPESLCIAMRGCDIVFHAAAISQYWRNTLSLLYAANVIGTRNVLRCARAEGVARVVLTSSVAVFGVPSADGELLNETSSYAWSPGRFHYAHSKLLAEAEAQRAVAAGDDVVIVNPATVLGGRDINFVGGEILRSAQRGFFRFAPPGSMGVVSADAVGVGHVLAAERGRTGERYLLNGENITHFELLRLVAEITGAPAPLGILPRQLLQVLATIAWRTSSTLGLLHPAFLTQMDLSARDMVFDGSKAHQEIGFPRVAARTAVEEAWNWYRRNGFL